MLSLGIGPYYKCTPYSLDCITNASYQLGYNTTVPLESQMLITILDYHVMTFLAKPKFHIGDLWPTSGGREQIYKMAHISRYTEC